MKHIKAPSQDCRDPLDRLFDLLTDRRNSSPQCTLEVYRGHIGINTDLEAAQEHFTFRKRTFSGKRGMLSSKHQLLDGFCQGTDGTIKLSNGWFYDALDNIYETNDKEAPFFWSTYLHAHPSIDSPTYVLPQAGSRIHVSSEAHKDAVLKELVLQFRYDRPVYGLPELVLYVLPDRRTKNRFIQIMTPALRRTRLACDEYSVGCIEPVVANSFGVRPDHLAVIFHDQWMLCTNTGMRYWKSAIENDVPLFAFCQPTPIPLPDMHIIDLFLGPNVPNIHPQRYNTAGIDICRKDDSLRP